MIRIPQHSLAQRQIWNRKLDRFQFRFDTIANLAVDIALSYLHMPYRWGGDDPIEGMDCSGMIVEIMQSVGRIPHGSDFTAHGLMTLFTEDEYIVEHRALAEPGALVFYGTKEKITHVGMIIGDGFMISASGGGSKTQTTQDAARQNAFVKIRPINYRPDLVIIVDPFISNTRT